MLHEDPTDCAPPSPAELLELQLSALLFLLARCATRPGDRAAERLALEHLQQLGRNGAAPELVRRTADRVARQWCNGAEPLGDAAQAPCGCRPLLH